MGYPVIGLVGYAGSGKDTVADYLSHAYGFQRVAFADPLKRLALELNPSIRDREDGALIPLKSIVDTMGWDGAKQHIEIREYLQHLGASVRDAVCEDSWIQATDVSLRGFVPEATVFTDVRYRNEAEYVQRSLDGVIVGVCRPGVGPVNGHPSESIPVDPYLWIENDGGLVDLCCAVDDAMEELGIERVDE